MKLALLWVTAILMFFSISSYATPSYISAKKILLVVAMDKEAAPIINALKLIKEPNAFPKLPMQGYQGHYAGHDIFLVLNGEDPINRVQNVGTQPASLSAYLGIAHFQPDLVISIGTAGGVGVHGAQIGDIYVSEKIYFYDRRIPVPGYEAYGLGGYLSENLDKIVDKMHLKKGIICSGDSFDESEADKEIILKYGCSAKEMEAASVAWVSMLMKTPMIAIKGISDIAEDPDNGKEYEKNAEQIHQNLAIKLQEFLKES